MRVMGDKGDFLPSGPANTDPASLDQINRMKRRLEDGEHLGI
jgi:hypothetical protein